MPKGTGLSLVLFVYLVNALDQRMVPLNQRHPMDKVDAPCTPGVTELLCYCTHYKYSCIVISRVGLQACIGPCCYCDEQVT